jgi:hypothetical protein
LIDLPLAWNLLGVRAFGFLEQLPDQMLEHIERLIGQCRREFQDQGRERGVATQRFEVRQVLPGTLVLVDAIGRKRGNQLFINGRKLTL